MDLTKITLYAQEGGQLVELGVAAYQKIRALFDGSATDAADDDALARLDGLYAARIEQAKKDAGA